MSGVELSDLAIAAVLVLLSAFFSSSESAFLSLRDTARLRHLVRKGSRDAIRVEDMLKDPGRLLSTILLMNNLVNIGFAALVTAIVISFLGERAGIVASTVVATVVLLIFGEVVPKTLAVRHAERVAFMAARPLKFFELFLLPIVAVLQWISRLANIGGRPRDTSITEDELRTLIDIAEAEGEFEPEEAEMLESVFRFGDRQVRDMMTPRTEMVSVARGTSMKEFLRLYAEHAHTRFPVYKNSTDNVVGILSAKDILRSMAANRVDLDGIVTDVIRDAYFVPETKRIAELFEELRDTGNQMAIVIDEFGGVAGLVTLKRLLEEVVGRVGEEGVRPEEEYEALGQDTYQVDGGMSVDEVMDELDIDLGDGDYETVAGFVLDALGHIPSEGETFETAGLSVEVAEMKGLKIEAVKLIRKPPSGQSA